MARATPPKGPRAAKPAKVRVANENAGTLQRQVAPWPLIDRTPTILGSHLTIAYLAATWRIAQLGYRQQLVDVLTELLEKDPHTFAVLTQRVLGVVSGRIELVAAPVTNPDSAEAKRAAEIRDDLQRRFDAIPAKVTAFSSLVFSGLYYGAGALEAMWDRRADGWWVRGLNFVHSRRVAYPDQTDWSPHIWDQGAVSLGWGSYPTEQFYGIRIADYPGKFLVHTPQLRADYPTREGLGRVIGWWMALKLCAARGGGEFVERFAKPWAFATYSTGEEGLNSKPRSATDPDIATANAVVAALGIGNLTGAAIPDSIKIELLGPAMQSAAGVMTHEKLIEVCDAQISKAVRGGTLQTDAGEKGARSLGEVHAEGDVRNARLDGAMLADTLRGSEDTPGLVWWLCHLNYPGEEALCPGVVAHVERLEPDAILDRVRKLVEINAPLDGRKVAEAVGVGKLLIDPEDSDAIRLAPLKQTDLFALLPTAAHDLPNALEALAAMVGVQLTPAMKSSLAEMDRDDAARLLQEILGAAKVGVKGTNAAGAAAEAGEPGDTTPEAPDAGTQPATPETTAARKGPQPTPAKPGARRSRPPKKPPKPAAKRRGAATTATPAEE